MWCHDMNIEIAIFIAAYGFISGFMIRYIYCIFDSIIKINYDKKLNGD